MKLLRLIVSFSALWTACLALDLKFPPGFKFGAATSAYQIEGAWNASDKGISIWDSMIHKDPSIIDDGTSGDVACDSYHQWKEDVQIAHDLGLHFYRFSISWTRILPTGFPNKISKDGVTYYNKLIDELLKKGIEPIVTLYHFDLPLSIQNLGGWTNPLIVDWFADYARVVFSMYANRIKTWVTINEPLIICDFNYNVGNLIPKITEEFLGPFICNKNVLMAHAKAYRIYEENYKEKYQGKISIANNPIWLEAQTEKDEELSEIAREFGVGRYSDPIYSKEGGWPPTIEKMMAEYSKKQGFPYSRLPSFTAEEKKLVQGTYDYFSLNHYTSRQVRSAREGEDPGLWYISGSRELNLVLEKDPQWPKTEFAYIVIHPEGIRRQIAWLSKRYNNVSILITENGLGTRSSDDSDTGRIRYIRDHLEQILLAIKEDGANVIGYTVWSLMDNFEWMFGHSMKFGLYNVDFTAPLRTRTPRASAHFYRSVIRHHTLDVPHPSHDWTEYQKSYNNGQTIKYSNILFLFVIFERVIYKLLLN
ncbi:myrosinase 1-like [Vanessa cardui]|uniref:myrosinase 1-like n=1 Tax=Vanessa cardui TaxID=171605 RepID=UPI001F1384F0|nr:myrosinase 1-like [Vanessa cardui]